MRNPQPNPARGLSRPGTQTPVAASPDAVTCGSGGGGKARRGRKLPTFKGNCIFWAKKGMRPADIARLLSSDLRYIDPNDVRIVLHNAAKKDPTIPRWKSIGRPPVFTADQVKWAAEQNDLGRQWRDIGKEMGCGHSTIWRAVKIFRNRGAHASTTPVGGSSCSPPCAAPMADDTRSGRAAAPRNLCQN